MKTNRAPTRRKLIDVLAGMMAAEEHAALLRKDHGPGAEGVCDGLIAAQRNNGLKAEHLKDVRRALRWV
jgi:hypothetical protein